MVHLYSTAIDFQMCSNYYHYSLLAVIIVYYSLLLLYIGITTSMSLALLFISGMQSVNQAQLLNITFLFILLGATALPVFVIVIVPLTSMYASL